MAVHDRLTETCKIWLVFAQGAGVNARPCRGVRRHSLRALGWACLLSSHFAVTSVCPFGQLALAPRPYRTTKRVPTSPTQRRSSVMRDRETNPRLGSGLSSVQQRAGVPGEVCQSTLLGPTQTLSKPRLLGASQKLSHVASRRETSALLCEERTRSMEGSRCWLVMTKLIRTHEGCNMLVKTERSKMTNTYQTSILL
jgi:hypothetical protein